MRINGPLDASLWPAVAGMGELGFTGNASWRYRQEDADGCCLQVLYAARKARITDEHDVEILCVCGRAWSCVDGWWQMPPRVVMRHDRSRARLGIAVNSQHRARARAQMAERVEAKRRAAGR